MKKLIIGLMLAVGLTVSSCGLFHYVPVETNTEVHVKDSLVLHIKDSIRISEATVLKDYAWITDTLRITGNRSSMLAYADTLRGCIAGTLKEDEVEEKYKIIYKDKLVYRDSIQTKEVPVPVEVVKEVKVIPKFYKIFTIIGIALSILGLAGLYFKFRNKIHL